VRVLLQQQQVGEAIATSAEILDLFAAETDPANVKVAGTVLVLLARSLMHVGRNGSPRKRVVRLSVEIAARLQAVNGPVARRVRAVAARPGGVTVRQRGCRDRSARWSQFSAASVPSGSGRLFSIRRIDVASRTKLRVHEPKVRLSDRLQHAAADVALPRVGRFGFPWDAVGNRRSAATATSAAVAVGRTLILRCHSTVVPHAGICSRVCGRAVRRLRGIEDK
jgi:hypothetical protein